MASIDPAGRRRAIPAGFLLILVLLIGDCAGPPPRLVPPAGEIEAVEGYGSASISGTEASVKGKFGFVFRRPDVGRIEALDPIGRTAFIIVFRGGRAWFVLPGRKVYAEGDARTMMERVLGIALEPREAVELLSGTWERGTTDVTPKQIEGGLVAYGAWRLRVDDQGRVMEGFHEDFAFTARSFFPGGAVPREIQVRNESGTWGRVKVLKLRFNPVSRPEAFDTAYLRAFTPKTWDEILELIER